MVGKKVIGENGTSMKVYAMFRRGKIPKDLQVANCKKNHENFQDPKGDEDQEVKMEVQDPEDAQTSREDENDIGTKLKTSRNAVENVGNAKLAMPDELPDFSWLLQVALPLPKRGACEVCLSETPFSFGNTCRIII